MKSSTTIQLYAAHTENGSGQKFCPETGHGIFYKQGTPFAGQEGHSQKLPGSFYDSRPGPHIFRHGKTGFAFPKNGIPGSEFALSKENYPNPEWQPFFTVYLKEAAARLSDLELAVDNYDAFMFQLTTHSLKGLFVKMKMPEASRITSQLEELAFENRFMDVYTMLNNIKKIIAQLVLSLHR